MHWSHNLLKSWTFSMKFRCFPFFCALNLCWSFFQNLLNLCGSFAKIRWVPVGCGSHNRDVRNCSAPVSAFLWPLEDVWRVLADGGWWMVALGTGLPPVQPCLSRAQEPLQLNMGCKSPDLVSEMVMSGVRPSSVKKWFDISPIRMGSQMEVTWFAWSMPGINQIGKKLFSSTHQTSYRIHFTKCIGTLGQLFQPRPDLGQIAAEKKSLIFQNNG